MQSNKGYIGLIGLGCVGEGFLELFERQKLEWQIKTIAVKDKNKSRKVNKNRLTYNYQELIDDEEIDLIVELIDDAEVAYDIAIKTLSKGKNLVSANKKMLAAHLEELLVLAKENSAILRFEASVCGSIPILDSLDSYLSNLNIRRLTGIVNGSSNFILSKMRQEKLSYQAALKLAQQQGFAESNPELDVSGADATNKLKILNSFAFNTATSSSVQLGIKHLEYRDIHFADQRGYRLKQIAYVNDSGVSFVLPTYVDKTHPLYNIEDEYNAVIVNSDELGDQLYIGKGAGSLPTGKAVLFDALSVIKKEAYTLSKLKVKSRTEQNFVVYLRFPSSFPAEFKQNNFSRVFQSSLVNYAIGLASLKDIEAWIPLLSKPGYFLSLLPEKDFAELPQLKKIEQELQAS